MSEGRVERRLAAILAIDVAGYSRLMGADEEGTLAALRAARRELCDPKIAEHRGRIVNTTGDGLLAEFASVVNAVRCAVAVQLEMIARNAATPVERLRAEVCDFSLDWTPGSRLQYHPRAAHLTQAMVIEAVTGRDYREVIRDMVLKPLGLANDIFVGVPREFQNRCADTYGAEPRDNSPELKAAGMPSGGGYATARGMAAFYQMLLGRGRLGDVRIFSPRLISYVTKSHTGERGDDAMGGIPMHRGLGPHVRGESDRIRRLGTLAAPETFGHGGAGTSYSSQGGAASCYIPCCKQCRALRAREAK